MPFIEIDKKPVIFDDPEYCRTYKGCCILLTVRKECPLYNDIKLKHAEITYHIIKCDECKTYYQKAKERATNAPT